MAGPSQSSLWSSLPGELLESILTFTKYPADIIRSSAVCLSWHSVASDLYRRIFPLFIVQSRGDDGCCGGSTLFNISPQGPRKVNLPEEPKFYYAADNGWLLTVGCCPPYDIHLLNPFSGFQILLPPLFPSITTSQWGLPFEWSVTSVKVSSCPSRPLCFVLVAFFFGLGQVICRPGDTEWITLDRIENFSGSFDDEMIYNDRLYGVYSGMVEETIFSCEINKESENPEDITSEEWESNLQIPVWLTRALPFIVKSISGEFWLVRKNLYDGNNREGVDGIESFQVLKIDMEKKKWRRVYDLGNQALVISETPYAAVSVACGSSAASFKRNCIYYVHEDLKRDRFDVGEYDFETMHTAWFDPPPPPPPPSQAFLGIIRNR